MCHTARYLIGSVRAVRDVVASGRQPQTRQAAVARERVTTAYTCNIKQKDVNLYMMLLPKICAYYTYDRKLKIEFI